MRTALRIPLLFWPFGDPAAQVTRLRIRRGIQDVAALGSGTLLAQMVLFLAAPILLRLYSPSDLGTFSALYGFNALLATFSTWKIERLIVIVPSRQESLHFLTALVAIAATVSAALLLVVAVIVLFHLTSFDAALLLMVPFSVLVLAVSAGHRALLIRRQAYRIAGMAAVTRSIVFLSGAIATGLWWHHGPVMGAVSMLFWQIAGDLAALSLQAWAIRAIIRLKLNRPRLRQAIDRIRRQGRLLGALGASQVICSINQQIPISIVIFAFGREHAGLYSLALGLVAAPCSVVAAAVADVVNQRLARLYAERRPFSHLFSKALGTMALLGIGPFLGIAVLGPMVLPALLGPQWVNAAPVVSILSIASYFFFVEAPAGHVALIVGARNYIFIWQMLRFGMLCTLAALAALKIVSFFGFLIFFVAGDCCLYVLEIVLVYRFIRQAEASWR